MTREPPNVPQDSLYAAHQKVYPREVTGRFNRLRTVAVILLLGLFYAMPWVRWDGHQALLFDLPARKFHVFALTFFPQDFFLLTWLLIIAALSLFFFTALAGRLWCGYACPQTVWTQIFVWMERLAEGTRQQRMKLDRGPWNFNKIWRKTAKQTMWISFALFTGYTFVGYFTPIRELTDHVLTASLGKWELFWTLFYGFATYGNAGYMREQVCKYMCPYARFQGAMFDRNTLIIAYDAARGEPRGSRPRKVDPRSRGLGDCIDCTLCVQACPTGIDIRKGLQLECIACAACIDACDTVMDQMGYPRGLVRYTTQNATDGKPTRILRPRVIVYGTLLTLLISGFAFAVASRQLIELDVLRDRNALYRTLDDGRIENVYTLRIVNKDGAPHTLTLRVEGLPGAELDAETPTLRVEPSSVQSVPVRVRAPAGSVAGGVDVRIVAEEADGKAKKVESKARFIAPVTP
jgi:cytochrome c oxidase accessory protein FixG